MSKRFGWVLLLSLALALALPGAALAQDHEGDRYVFDETYTLADGETLNGNLYVIGGKATLEDGSHVTGDVISWGGSLAVDGEIGGDIAATGGSIVLGGTAVVSGDVNVLGADLDRSPEATVKGDVNMGSRASSRFPFSLPGPDNVQIPGMEFRYNPFFQGLATLFKSIAWLLVAVLLVMFLPRPVERLTRTIVSQPLISTGMGVLTAVAIPIVLAIIAITLILIPASLLGVVVLMIAWALGLISVGTEVGRRLSGALHQDWALAVCAGVGTFIVTLTVNLVQLLVPCVGWLAPALVGSLGLGAVVLTRFGTQDYPPRDPLAPGGYIPPAEPPIVYPPDPQV